MMLSFIAVKYIKTHVHPCPENYASEFENEKYL